MNGVQRQIFHASHAARTRIITRHNRSTARRFQTVVAVCGNKRVRARARALAWARARRMDKRAEVLSIGCVADSHQHIEVPTASQTNTISTCDAAPLHDGPNLPVPVSSSWDRVAASHRPKEMKTSSAVGVSVVQHSNPSTSGDVDSLPCAGHDCRAAISHRHIVTTEEQKNHIGVGPAGSQQVTSAGSRGTSSSSSTTGVDAAAAGPE